MMTKTLATCAALAMTAAFAMPVPASAQYMGRADLRADLDGVSNVDVIEVASRKHRRHVQRYYGPRYGYRYGYRYRPYYYDAPYYAYAPRYYRPYYGPGVSVGVGPFGFGFGF